MSLFTEEGGRVKVEICMRSEGHWEIRVCNHSVSSRLSGFRDSQAGESSGFFDRGKDWIMLNTSPPR